MSSFLRRAQTCGHSPNSASSALGVSWSENAHSRPPPSIIIKQCSRSQIEKCWSNHRNRCGPKSVPVPTPRLHWWHLCFPWLFAEPKDFVLLAANPLVFVNAAADPKDSAVVDVALLVFIWRLDSCCCNSRTTVGSAGEIFQIGGWVLRCAVWMETADVEWGGTGGAQSLASDRRAALTFRVKQE